MRRDDFAALLEQRIHLFADADELHQKAKRENRNLTEEEKRSWDSTMRELQAINVEVEANRPQPAEARPDSSAPTEHRSSVDVQIEEAFREVSKGETRALSTAVTLSPGTLSNVLFDKLRAQSVGLSSGFRVLTTDKDSVVHPTLSADANPSWYAEAATISPGDPTFSSVTATPRKIAHLVQMSNEVIDDSDPSIVDVLNNHLLRVLALKLDIGFYEGSGTAPEIRGLKNVVGIQSISMGANGAALTSLDTISDALHLLEAANTEATAIVMAPRTYNTLRKLKATTNEYLLTERPSVSAPRSLFGVPVYVSGQLSVTETQGTATNASSVYVYNAAEVVYVRRSEIELELDRSRLFNSDQSELRAKLRGDLIVPNPSAVVRIAGITP